MSSLADGRESTGTTWPPYLTPADQLYQWLLTQLMAYPPKTDEFTFYNTCFWLLLREMKQQPKAPASPLA